MSNTDIDVDGLKTMTDDKLRKILAGCKGVTPGPWELEESKNYEDGHGRYQGYSVVAPEQSDMFNVVTDCSNATVAVIHDEDGFRWDEQGERNMSFFARLDPQTVAAIVTELLARRALQPTDAGGEPTVAALRQKMIRTLYGADVERPEATETMLDALIWLALNHASPEAGVAVGVLREFAESFHFTVLDNTYKDVTLHLDKPHALSIRLTNSSDKSWLFQDLEARRLSALASSTVEREADK